MAPVKSASNVTGYIEDAREHLEAASELLRELDIPEAYLYDALHQIKRVFTEAGNLRNELTRRLYP